jgi:hypothetical protein
MRISERGVRVTLSSDVQTHLWSWGCRQVIDGSVGTDYQHFLPETLPTLSCPPLPADIPLHDLTYEATSNIWRKWSDMVEPVNFPENASFRDMFVPTPDSVRYTFLVEAALKKSHPILLVGPPGTALSHAKVCRLLLHLRRLPHVLSED